MSKTELEHMTEARNYWEAKCEQLELLLEAEKAKLARKCRSFNTLRGHNERLKNKIRVMRGEGVRCKNN
jgi:hypothetical protein